VNNDQNEKKQIEDLGLKYQARILEAFHNPGFGSAANRGAEQSLGNILFFINPDTEWKEPFFSSVVQQFQEKQKRGAVGVQLIDSLGIPESEQMRKVFSLPGILGFSSHPLAYWVSGGALFIPKNIFQEIGGFDERFFMYFEDMDICVRLQKAGYEIFFHKEHSIVHLGGKSHITKKTQKKVYDQSLYLYIKKYWAPFPLFIFRLLHPFYRFIFPYGRK
jgi:GT2 family glycosyltransferase